MDLLNNNFQFFTDDNYIQKINIDHLGKFPLINEDWPLEINCINNNYSKNNIIVENTFYNIKFYHDFNEDLTLNFEEQIKLFHLKYLRRIQRFQEICCDKNIKKIFVRICKNIKEKEILEEVLKKYCQNNNLELKIIIIDNKQKFSSWKKDEINWNNFFIDPLT